MLQFLFDDLQHLLIRLARGLKYFHDVELLYPSDEFQTNWISKIKYGLNVTRSNKKGIEVEESKKHTFFIQSSFCPLFCEKINFLTAPERSCRRCGQCDMGVTICV